jgi:hypothetical protein
MSRPDVQHVTLAMPSSADEVYELASNPENLPRWAQGLAGSIERDGEQWVADSPMGRVRIRFTAPNAFGVLDHDVTLPSGETVHNPMRVVPRPDGTSEVTFTIFRREGVSDEEFAADAAAVARDLRALKELVE